MLDEQRRRMITASGRKGSRHPPTYALASIHTTTKYWHLFPGTTTVPNIGSLPQSPCLPTIEPWADSLCEPALLGRLLRRHAESIETRVELVIRLRWWSED